ncbi:SLIT and NTRK-like protein 6 [Saccostrea echinata]|uniref:SLIT and NTRK-like protein 6 n=1 Tax=Saccostrea echinata TaxID=191078 RepID=UPI002A83144B|nr:SLIT and NTRK-like protein 6 [Saccostrea echinata]
MAGSYVTNFNIRGCLLVEDYKTQDPALSVELTTDVTLENCVIKINSYEYVKNQIENLSARNCDEQLSLKSEIMRNVSFTFTEFNKTHLSVILKDAGVNAEAFAQGILKAEELCIYENMTYYERSFNNPNSGMHNNPHLQTLYKMPNLRVYNFSSNSLLQIPSTLKTIRYYYPSLEILDLSNNNVKETSFSQLNSSLSSGPLYIDLRNNNITNVSENQVQEFLENDVIVDLRDNPITCDCSAVFLKSYLLRISTAWPKWATTADITCSQPSKLVDKLLADFDDEFLCNSHP